MVRKSKTTKNKLHNTIIILDKPRKKFERRAYKYILKPRKKLRHAIINHNYSKDFSKTHSTLQPSSILSSQRQTLGQTCAIFLILKVNTLTAATVGED